MLDFDGMSAFSNPRVLYTPATGTAVTYSSFFPNAAGSRLRGRALESVRGLRGYTWNNNTGELWWVDVASGHRAPARRAQRVRGNGRGLPPEQRRRQRHPHAGARRDAQLRAHGEPDRVRRLRLGRVHEPAHVRQRRAARTVDERSARLPVARPRSPTRSSGSPRSTSTQPRAPIRATPRSTCPRRSSTPATRAATGRSSRAAPTGRPA